MFNESLMGNEIIHEYASNISIKELPAGKDKNISRARITIGEQAFTASFMGRVRMLACRGCIEKGAEFDVGAVKDMERRRKIVQGRRVVPMSRLEWNFRTQLMQKNVGVK
jgi:hypothetical protein